MPTLMKGGAIEMACAADVAVKQLEGIDYRTGEAIQIIWNNGMIDAVKPTEKHREMPIIAPGFVDLQINGFWGIDFNTSPIETSAVHEVTRKLWAQGVTTYYPTVITNAPHTIEEMVRSIAKACGEDALTAASIAGIHVEGPFISPEDGPRGAHSKQFVRPPDFAMFERWQEAAGGLIKLITLSPEWDEAPAFIRDCVRSGVAVSIGHTAASSVQLEAAVEAGASLSTHLGNGAHQMLPRHPNYIWDQLANEKLSATVIADGFHLPTAVLKVMLKAKGNQLFLVSDAVYLSGLEPGDYETHIGGKVVLTEEGRLHLAQDARLLAGSVQMLGRGVEHLVRTETADLRQAWDMASILPASFMGLHARQGLSPGAPADLIAFDWAGNENAPLKIKEVYKQGKRVFDAGL